jgi:hypothetical protein
LFELISPDPENNLKLRATQGSIWVRDRAPFNVTPFKATKEHQVDWIQTGSHIPGVLSLGQSGTGYVVTGAGEPYNPWESQIYEEYLAGGGNPYDYARPGYELP